MAKILIKIPDDLELMIGKYKDDNKIRYKEEAILSIIDSFFNYNK